MLDRLAPLLLALAVALAPATALARHHGHVAPAPEVADVYHVRVEGEIDSGTVMDFKDQLDGAKKAGAKKLVIHIESPGGSVFAGLALVQAVRAAGLPTVCVVEDYAASMAAVFLQSSACGERVVHAQSIVMLHSVSGSAEGNAHKGRQWAKTLRAVDKMVAVIVCSRAHWDLGKYLHQVADRGEELWYVGSEARRAGLADRVLPAPGPQRGSRPSGRY